MIIIGVDVYYVIVIVIGGNGDILVIVGFDVKGCYVVCFLCLVEFWCGCFGFVGIEFDVNE